MFKKLLIANRGEIACRVMRTAKRMGIKTLAVYSDADEQALHVQLADEAVHIGASPAAESYLQGEKIVALAKTLGADAIHPGYGFLSENADFAQQCAEQNITFVGPPVSAIEAMGSKAAAKQIMQQAGVPLIPGYHGNDQSEQVLKREAEKIGYPVLLKAAAGGGGKGMRQVLSAAEFDEALASAKRESLASFNDDRMLVEKYLTEPRHIEIQVFCDQHGKGVYLFERDCSVQRRHQKIIEEAPAPGLNQALREKMGQAALQAAHAIHYTGAGTVEFLLGEDEQFYFMEMNTRLQVEHPVTEMITGQDLVEWQLRVAKGEDLPLSQAELSINGHAFEARIYAEDPDNDFLPATGQLNALHLPAESAYVRLDTGVVQGDNISVYYDPMIAKLIVWDENRHKALNRLVQAFSQYQVQGVTTNIGFLANLASSQPFTDAQLSTHFIEQYREILFPQVSSETEKCVPLACLALLLDAQANQSQVAHAQDPYSPWDKISYWRANQSASDSFDIQLQGKPYSVIVTQLENAYRVQFGDQSFHCSGYLQNGYLHATIDGHKTRTPLAGNKQAMTLLTSEQTIECGLVQADLGLNEQQLSDADYQAPINGTIVTLLVSTDEQVKANQPLIVIEAMKMEHSIKAHADGKVSAFFCEPGELVDSGALLLEFESDSI